MTEQEDIENKLEFAATILSELFSYSVVDWDFLADPEVHTEGLQRILVYENSDELFDEHILKPVDYFEAGRFIGRLLHLQVNQTLFTRGYIAQNRLRNACRRNIKTNDLPRENNEDRKVRRIIELLSGRVVAEAQLENYRWDQPQEFDLTYRLDLIYRQQGKKLISQLARLNGMGARTFILKDYNIDINPGMEQ